MATPKNDKGDKFGLRVKQVFIGLGSGFIGIVAYSVLVPPTDLYADTRNALLAGLFTMIAAITLINYLHDKEKKTNGE